MPHGNKPPFSIRKFPRAIMHVDGDAFFASCEQALDPSLKGKPVITGKERGIVSAASYEAKRLGVKTGMALGEARKVCPSAVILPSNYEAYSLFSTRMYEIVRRFTSEVEEYSIDECFADITGLRRPLNMTYEDIARKIKSELDSELGFTFSVGLSATKVLAKVGSKWEKPNGLTVIPARDAHLFLEKLPISKVWGIGPQTTDFLYKKGVRTALELASCSDEWIRNNLSKPFQDIYYELRGVRVLDLETKRKDYASISKTRTFSPSSGDSSLVFSELSKNIENACIKLRRHNLRARRASFFLKTSDFRYRVIEIELDVSTNEPISLIRQAEKEFYRLFKPGMLYRSTGVRLSRIEGGGVQLDLFGGREIARDSERIYREVDRLAEKYGKHTVFTGSSFQAVNSKSESNYRKVLPDRFSNLLKGESARRHLNIPIIGEVN